MEAVERNHQRNDEESVEELDLRLLDIWQSESFVSGTIGKRRNRTSDVLASFGRKKRLVHEEESRETAEEGDAAGPEMNITAVRQLRSTVTCALKHQRPNRPKEAVPNYFLALPITNSLIVEKSELLQRSITDKQKHLKSACVSVAKLHITLMVMRLDSQEDIVRARRALESSRQSILQSGSSAINLAFGGAGHFGGKVVFLKPSESDAVTRLHQVADVVRKSFEEHGIKTTDSKAFEPHVTILKLSKAPMLRRKGIKRIDEELYSDFICHDFGMETFSRMQLCSMIHPPNPVTKYYHCEHEVWWTVPEKAEVEELKPESGSGS